MIEFQVYKRIIDGDLRPQLKSNQSSEVIEKEFYSMEYTSNGDVDHFLENIGKLATEFHGVQPGDEIKIELPEDGDPPKIVIQRVQNELENELINIDIPPAPDDRTETYLRLVEDEYVRIKSSLVENLAKLQTSDKLETYAKKNILFGKELGKKAHLLEKKLAVEGVDNLHNPNTYVVYIVKRHLIYSLLKIQDLFGDIAELKSQTPEQLEDDLFDFQHSRMMAKFAVMDEKMNSKHLKEIYTEAGPEKEKIRDALINKVMEYEARIEKDRQSKYGVAKYVFDRKELYLKELGNILEEMLFEEFNGALQNGLICKYELLIETATRLQHNSSIESRALNKTDFIDRLDFEIKSTKELIEISKVQLVKEEIYPDLVNLCLTIQTRKRLNLSEDEWNNYLTDLLRAKRYGISDQTQSGQSGSASADPLSGELDITVRDSAKSGTIKTIIEGMELKSCGPKNRTVPEHIDRLINRYDTAGNDECFLIVYAKAANFNNLWLNYQKRIGEMATILSTKDVDSGKSDLKIAISEYKREERTLKLKHLFVNMAIK